jgi:hypothetical protein
MLDPCYFKPLRHILLFFFTEIHPDLQIVLSFRQKADPKLGKEGLKGSSKELSVSYCVIKNLALSKERPGLCHWLSEHNLCHTELVHLCLGKR